MKDFLDWVWCSWLFFNLAITFYMVNGWFLHCGLAGITTSNRENVLSICIPLSWALFALFHKRINE